MSKSRSTRRFNGREHERVRINKEFESLDAFLQEYATNISRSGVFIRAKAPLAVGTLVDLHFTVLLDGIETVEGVGEVVRVDSTGMGLVFRSLTEASQRVLDRLLRETPGGGLVATTMAGEARV